MDRASRLRWEIYCQTAADIMRPAVVDITKLKPFGQQSQGTGSGVVIDDQGHILTNNHVVDGAQSIEARFADASTLSAEVVEDPANDIALIKVDPSGHDLTVANLGDSEALRVGYLVLAIGSPFNLEGTLTQGIVSALSQDYATGANTRPLRGMIQTDAAVYRATPRWPSSQLPWRSGGYQHPSRESN